MSHSDDHDHTHDVPAPLSGTLFYSDASSEPVEAHYIRTDRDDDGPLDVYVCYARKMVTSMSFDRLPARSNIEVVFPFKNPKE